MNADGSGVRPAHAHGRARGHAGVVARRAAGSPSRATGTCARGPRERNGRDFELYVMRADGSHVRRLTRNRVPDLYPSWQAVR